MCAGALGFARAQLREERRDPPGAHNIPIYGCLVRVTSGTPLPESKSYTTINSELSAIPRCTSYLYAGVVVEPSLLGPILEIHLRIRAVVLAVVRLLAHAPEAAWLGLGLAWLGLGFAWFALTLTLTLTTAAWSGLGRPNPNQGRPNLTLTLSRPPVHERPTWSHVSFRGRRRMQWCSSLHRCSISSLLACFTLALELGLG